MRVLIDHGVLSGYQARAKLFYPLEYGEFLWGHIEGEDFVITVIDRAYGEATDNEEDPELEMNSPYEFGDVVNGQTLLGTIHSHQTLHVLLPKLTLKALLNLPPKKSLESRQSVNQETVG
jgi:hypothetical protein